MEKNFSIENAKILNGYYNSVILLQKEEMNRVTTELDKLCRLNKKISKESQGMSNENANVKYITKI